MNLEFREISMTHRHSLDGYLQFAQDFEKRFGGR